MKYYATKFANTTHSPLPQFVTHGNAIYAHPANKTVGTHVTPWFERRGNKIYATPSNPAGGHSALPWFEVKGNMVYTTMHNPTGHTHMPVYQIRK